MEALEGLKVVVRGGVGYDVIDIPAATDLGVVVVNVPGLVDPTKSEGMPACRPPASWR
jgi:lactate dehydrogenase-like 2-hydroxyacid dehydrogenase